MNDAGNAVLKDGSQTEVFFANNGKGLKLRRYFTKEGVHPYDGIEWEKRAARITSSKGEVIFEQKDVEAPKFWSQTATDIVAEKYFKGHIGKPGREWSVKQLMDRVADTMTDWGRKDGYFASEKDAQIFNEELKWLLVNQYASFNSPVWFNVGVEKKPQCSACFILSIADDKESIAEWYRTEMFIFSGGSGSGINISPLRSSRENISNRGKSSGPVSFMKGADAIAGTIRSGGKTRRAAKMVILNADHPDIKQFIVSKWKEEEKAKALIALGYDDAIDGDVYSNIFFQNANNSVRATDEFMEAALGDKKWDLKMVKTGEAAETLKARDLMRLIAEAAWHCADPGMQFDTTINKWHTAPNTGRINAYNPCSEYMHLDNSACNLASLNLLKFLKEGGKLNVELFKKAVDTVILAQDILVDNSSYPTPKITQNAKDYRELGLGYANLGALLMVLGWPYDSDGGRALAGHITSLMCGEAYRMSALLADVKGSYAGFEKNKAPQLNVISKHLAAAEKLYEESQSAGLNDVELQTASRLVWHEALVMAMHTGIRNSQMTGLAPPGTIAFLMDCQTTGIEPDLALVKYKKLVGGGTLKLINNQVPLALSRLGYANQEIEEISNFILEKDTIEEAPHLKPDHLPVFDCSFRPINGQRSISWQGHVKMMAAAQPFISGAISKTVNLPADATREDIKNVFIEGWRLGLKAIAVYRDGCKSIQPLNLSNNDKFVERSNGYTRIKLPDERPAVTHKFKVAGHKGYLTVGLYPETNQPGETFLTIAKEGSTISGLLDVIATMTSICLQSGVPLKTLVNKFKDMRFDPAGFTTNPEIPMAKSVVDYMFRYMGMKYLNASDREELFGMPNTDNSMENRADFIQAPAVQASHAHITTNMDAPACGNCGTLMVKAGSCYSCPNCFTTTGVCN